MHALWSGILNFGLVNIPVKLYSGTKQHNLKLHMLHSEDLSPIRYARVCREEGEEVPHKEIIKGYEFSPGEYVPLTEEDFNKAVIETRDTIDIVSFVEENDIDTIYFEKPYYLEPGKGGNKVYRLLNQALLDSGKVGIALFVFHNREHIGIIKATDDDMLILMQMRYADEIRNVDELKLPHTEKLKKSELDLAIKLVNELSEGFDPKKYHDEYKETLEKIIADKLKGKKIKTGEEKISKASNVYDIMSLLKKSLEKNKRSAKHKTKQKAAHKKKSTKKRKQA